MAMSTDIVQEGGTFRRAVWLKLQYVISSQLAQVVAVLDRDDNLDLILPSSPEPVKEVWMNILQQESLIMDLLKNNNDDQHNVHQEVFIPSSGASAPFQAQFPFSGAIVQQIDLLLIRDHQSCSNISLEYLHKCESVLKSSMLSSVFPEFVDDVELVNRYLGDFLHIKYPATSEIEHNLVKLSLQNMIEKVLENCSIRKEEEELEETVASHTSLIMNLIIIHELYRSCRPRLELFSQLVRVSPETVGYLGEQKARIVAPDGNMMLDALALQAALEQLDIECVTWKDSLSNVAMRQQWVQQVEKLHPVVEQMFAAHQDLSPVKVSRSLWQRINVIRLLFEHMLPADPLMEDLIYRKMLKMLWKSLERADLHTAKSFTWLINVLRKVNESASTSFLSGGVRECPVCKEVFKDPVGLECKHIFCRNCIELSMRGSGRTCPVCRAVISAGYQPRSTTEIKEAVEKHGQFRQRCNMFFLDVVSRYCFVPDHPPDKDIIKSLMSFILLEKGSNIRTRNLTPFTEDCIDPTPVIRSYLLQLVLQYSFTDVKNHVQNYIEDCRKIPPFLLDINSVCVMIVLCIEDSFYNQCLQSNAPEKEKLEKAQQCLDVVGQHIQSPNLSLELLEAIAQIRFSFSVLAGLMWKCYQTNASIDEQTILKLRPLMERAREICQSHVLSCSDSVTWPHLFLLRQMCLHYSIDFPHEISLEIPRYSWLVPRHLLREQVSLPDYYLSYGNVYQELRESLARDLASHSKMDHTMLHQALAKVSGSPHHSVLIALSIYQEITVSMHNLSEGVSDSLMTEMDQQNLGQRHRDMVQRLTTNDLGPLLVQPGLNSQELMLRSLVIHLVIVLGDGNIPRFLSPLMLLAHHPQGMMDKLFPTMPQDMTLEAMNQLRLGRYETAIVWYECPRGHPYAIGNCGKPASKFHCMECGESIGGLHHNLEPGNRSRMREDRTKFGHALGSAADQPSVVTPERSLMAVHVLLLRFLMHAAMSWSAIVQPTVTCQLFNPHKHPHEVFDFIWNHLKLNFRQLSSMMVCSEDDLTIIIHRTIAGLLRPCSERVSIYLETKPARENWERTMRDHYLIPPLENVTQYCAAMNAEMRRDNRFGSSQLVKVLHTADKQTREVPIQEFGKYPSVWEHRFPLTIENLHQQLGQQPQWQQCELLRQFIEEEHQLRAVRFLPHILRLQNLLVQHYQGQLNARWASQLTLEEFIVDIHNPQLQEELRSLVEQFIEAWNTVRLMIATKLKNLVSLDMLQRPLSMHDCVGTILPVPQGAGMRMIALTHYLIQVHNDFVEKFVRKNRVKPQIVPPDLLSSPQLISFEAQDLLLTVLAHCQYSQKPGQQKEMDIDLPMLERRLMDRFIRGRPQVSCGCKEQQLLQRDLSSCRMPQLFFRGEYTLSEQCIQLQERVPQLPLPPNLKKEVVSGLRLSVDISDLLDKVTQVIEFLSVGGGDAEMKLLHYLCSVLQEPHLPVFRVVDSFCLKHVFSLWKVLKFMQARQTIQIKQDPFSRMPVEYQETLTDDLVTVLQGLCQSFQCEAITELILEFIHMKLNIRPVGDNSGMENWSLKDAMEAYFMQQDNPDIPDLLQRLPAEVQLRHACSTFKFLVSETFKRE